jgi:hypothetical protein
MLFSMPVQVVQQSTSSNREEERYEIRHSVDYADSEFLDSGQLSADPIDHTFTSIDVRGSRYTEADGVNDAGAIVGTAYGVLDRLNLPRRTDGLAAHFGPTASEKSTLRQFGCQRLLECTPNCLGRDPELLARLSDVTDLCFPN